MIGTSLVITNNLKLHWLLPLIILTSLIHGFAQGNEIPLDADVIQYIGGFLVSSISLLVIGIFIGIKIKHDLKIEYHLKLLGATVAGIGIAMLFNL